MERPDYGKIGYSLNYGALHLETLLSYGKINGIPETTGEMQALEILIKGAKLREAKEVYVKDLEAIDLAEPLNNKQQSHLLDQAEKMKQQYQKMIDADFEYHTLPQEELKELGKYLRSVANVYMELEETLTWAHNHRHEFDQFMKEQS